MENKTIEQTINFSQLHEQNLCHLFQIKEDLTKSILSDWETKANKVIITQTEQQAIDDIFYKTKYYGRGWNKAENMRKCIAPLLELVDFDILDNYKAAYNRALKTEHKHLLFHQKIDAMVISTVPHFILNIFEKDEVLDNEPTGELLAALLATQLKGKNPIYGVYVIRQMWIFVVLDNQKYALSKAFITDSKEKLEGIFKMLKAQKEMILEVMQG